MDNTLLFCNQFVGQYTNVWNNNIKIQAYYMKEYWAFYSIYVTRWELKNLLLLKIVAFSSLFLHSFNILKE